MKASFVDLRRKSASIIGAVNRNETITIYYRGKPAAVMQSLGGHPSAATDPSGGRICRARDHAAFGLWAARNETKDVPRQVRKLRQGRFHAL